jgi:hypothetical protein
VSFLSTIASCKRCPAHVVLGVTRILDYYHACQYVQQLADSIFGPGAESQSWATRMRKQLKTQRAGVARVLQSAAALRHKCGLRGQAQV